MKNTLIGLVAVLVLVSLGFFIGSKKSSDRELNIATTTPNVTSGINTQKTTTQPKTSSIAVVKSTTPLATNLFPQKGSYECKYEQATPVGRSTNTIYIADGKLRAEFRSMDAQGFGTLSMMVYDGAYLYSWIEGQGVGKVTRPASLKDIPVVVPADIHEGKVLGSGIDNVSWDCHAWSKTTSLLNKPSYVKFQ